MNTSNTELWNLLDKLRGSIDLYDLLSIVREAKAQDIRVNFEDLRAINLGNRRSGSLILPGYVTDFIIDYSKNRFPKSILDCWAGIGDVLSPLVQNHKPDIAIGLNRTLAELDLAKLLQPEFPINWQGGEPLDLIEQIKLGFDLIVGCPPWGMRTSFYAIGKDGQELELYDDYSSLLMLKASLLLNNSGSGLFVLPAKFIIDKGKRTVITHLNQFGLGIDAVFNLPNGTFAPATSSGGLLVVICREPRLTTFVGEITADVNQRKILLKNLKARKEGKSPHLGAIVKLESFRSFHALIASQEISNRVRSLGLTAINLAQICTDIKLPKRTVGEEFADLPNAIYLPAIGNSPVVSSLSELQIKPQNYIQLVIDPSKAIATYVAHSLNTDYGQKTREFWASGLTIPRITKANLSNAIVYLLPEINEQSELISTQTIITEISANLETLTHELWNHQRKYKEIQKRLKVLQSRNSFEEWLETLPYPISSVLWAYHADAVTEDKVDQLLLFFEALAEFLAVVMLSAYATDSEFYARERNAWLDKDPRFKDWVLTSSFGHWVILGERLAKFTRKQQEDKDNREFCTRLWGFPTTEFLSMLTDKSLFSILKEINSYRNQWAGHKGKWDNKAHEHHLRLLEAKLAETRKIMQDKWESTLFLSPMMSEYSDDIFEYHVKVLAGTRIPFKEKIVKTLSPMDKNQIYILHSQQLHPVKLLPFIRLMESPKTQVNAIYFYNRMVSNNEVRWLSYYFDKDSEIIRSDDAVNSALRLLMINTDER